MELVIATRLDVVGLAEEGGVALDRAVDGDLDAADAVAAEAAPVSGDLREQLLAGDLVERIDDDIDRQFAGGFGRFQQLEHAGSAGAVLGGGDARLGILAHAVFQHLHRAFGSGRRDLGEQFEQAEFLEHAAGLGATGLALELAARRGLGCRR